MGLEVPPEAWRIEPGNTFDSGSYVSSNFTVLDRNLFEIPENQIHKAVVNQTWFEGKKVYESDKKVSF